MNEYTDLNPQPLPPKDAITVLLPASVLNDFDAFTKVQRSVLGRLGCDGCTSGYDILWKKFQQYVINDKLEVREIAGIQKQFG